MTVFLWDKKLTYFAVPKCACTSIKQMFFAIENGEPFKKYRANGKVKHIHNGAYPTIYFSKVPHASIKEHSRIAVVRNPIERFLSAYSNRVLFHKALSDAKIAQHYVKLGAFPDPSLTYFIENIDLYRQASGDIRHHTDPRVSFLGTDVCYYDEIFSIARLEEFEKYVSSVLGVSISLSKHQTGGPKILRENIQETHIKMLKKMYEQDYHYYQPYFS